MKLNYDVLIAFFAFMSKRKDNLHEFIKKLTPSEKRYFKLFVKGKSSGTDNKYIQLFDAISRQANYNEAILLKKFDYGKNPNGLAVAKNYLFQLLLKCLRNYDNNKSVDAEVFGLIQDVQSLYDRRLFQTAHRNIVKAHKLAKAVERDDLLLLICKWERRLVEQVAEASAYIERYENLMEREKNASYVLETNTTLFTQYKKLQFRNLSEGYNQPNQTHDVFYSILKHPLLEKGRIPTHPTSQLYYWMCQFEYQCGMKNLLEASLISVKIMRHFKKYPALKQFDIESYLICSSNYLLFTLESGEGEVFQEEIVKFQALEIPPNNYFLERKKTIYYFNLMLIYYEMTGSYEEAVEVLAPQIKAYFRTHKHGLIDHEEFLLKNTASWIYLVVGQPEEAAVWLSYLDVEINRNVFLDYFVVCRILQLAVHYSLKNFQLVESIAKSTTRILDAKGKFSASDAFIIKFFKKAGATGDVREKQVKLLEQFKEEIRTIYQYMDGRTAYHLDGIIAWADSILTNQPLAKILREQSERVRSNAIRVGREAQLTNNWCFVIRRGYIG